MTLKMKFPDFSSCFAHNANQWSVIWKLALVEKVKIIFMESCPGHIPHYIKSIEEKSIARADMSNLL